MSPLMGLHRDDPRLPGHLPGTRQEGQPDNGGGVRVGMVQADDQAHSV